MSLFFLSGAAAAGRSARTVDRDGEGVADLPHPSIAQSSEPVAEYRQREVRSRRGGGFPERCEVAPLVWLVERVLVEGGVTCIYFPGAVACE